jgi:putative transposase
VDFVRRWSEKAEIGIGRFIPWLGVTASKFYNWRQRYGCVNEHNGWVPRDFWMEPWEKEAIIEFHLKNPLEGYRRLTFMMLDADVVAVSPASVWRVLKQAGLLSRWKRRPSRKGTGFEQPLQSHQHWHIDVSYINLCGTFYYLCSILDGFSRFLNVRLNSAIGYVTPKDVLAGRQQEIHAERDRKLEAARQQRQSHRQQAA